MQKETLAWDKKAEADWFGARQLDAEKHRVNDVICIEQYHQHPANGTGGLAKTVRGDRG